MPSSAWKKKTKNKKQKKKKNTTWIQKTKITNVLVEQELEFEKISKLEALNISWLYVSWSSLYINPEEISNDDYAAEQIHRIIGWEKAELKRYIRKRDLRYIPIYNKISISLSEEIKTYLDEERDAIKKWILSLEKAFWKSIILSPNPYRLFPEKEIGSQIMWFTDSSWEGHYWLEWEFNTLLRWQKSHIISKKDIKNKKIGIYSILVIISFILFLISYENSYTFYITLG